MDFRADHGRHGGVVLQGNVKKADCILLTNREIQDAQKWSIVGVVPVDAAVAVALPCPFCILNGGREGVAKLT